MSYCCCTPQIHCRYCQKSRKEFRNVKPFFKLSDKDYGTFMNKHTHSPVPPAQPKEPEQRSDSEHLEPVTTFDEVWDSIEWDKWRMEPIRELCRMIISKTTPPQRTWVGLTDEEREQMVDMVIADKKTKDQIGDLQRMVEAKLKEKNTSNGGCV